MRVLIYEDFKEISEDRWSEGGCYHWIWHRLQFNMWVVGQIKVPARTAFIIDSSNDEKIIEESKSEKEKTTIWFRIAEHNWIKKIDHRSSESLEDV